MMIRRINSLRMTMEISGDWVFGLSCLIGMLGK